MDSCKQIYKYLLKQNTQVVALITRNRFEADKIKTLTPIINQYVTENWSLRFCSETELTLLVRSSESANRLRYKSLQLLSEIRTLESFNKLKEIKIKLVPASDTEIKTDKYIEKKQVKLSSSGGKDLEALAESVSDQGLKASLLRLAGRLQD